MYNLIRKDLLVQKKIGLIYLAILVLYFMTNTPFVLLSFFVSMSFIMNTSYYDEKDQVNILLNSLPYTRKEIVSSKYIGALVFTSMFIGIITIGNLIVKGNGANFLWKDILLVFGLVMATMAITMPLVYKFKQQHLLTGIFILVGIYMVTFKMIYAGFTEVFTEVIQWVRTLPEIQLYSFTGIIILFLYAGSWLLSIRIYERKVF